MSGLGQAANVTYGPLSGAQMTALRLGRGLGGLVRSAGSWWGLPLQLEGSGPQGADKWRSLGYPSEAAYRDAILKNHQRTGEPLPSWMKVQQATAESSTTAPPPPSTPAPPPPAPMPRNSRIIEIPLTDDEGNIKPGQRPAFYQDTGEAVTPAPSPTGRDASDPSGQSGAKGTQMGSRSASYDDVMALLGPYAAQFVPMNSSALPTTSPGQQQLTESITPRTFTVGKGTYEVDADYLEAQQDLIDQRSRYHVGNDQTMVEIGGKMYPVSAEAEQDLADQASEYFNTENRQFAGTADGLDQTRTVDASNKNSGINWANRSALDNSDESVRRRTAFLDAPDVLSGLKARDHLYNKYYASGQYHEIPEKGGKTEVTYNKEDVRRFMNADIGSEAQAEAQTLLESYKDRIKKGAATAQNPMLNADESEGKATATAATSQEADFTENNASPTEMKPMMQNTPYGGYVNGKPVDLQSSNTPRNLRYTLTPEEVDEGLANGTLDQMQSELRPLPQN